ncbi:MFS transporter [Paenibacillus sp. XY044]|uniref:MFS transporter n=1 Tax=Paenibacillus sp. XY044 TaxID=2026089 RepID=UPI000B98AF39|nr:MFS transporter [Paenibacillus sp. XY044]OZB97994.1 hypothetical protein CJP46_02180 [Paenibacillus sp. XY044]
MNRLSPEIESYIHPRRWSRDFAWLYADQLLSVFAGTCGTFVLSWLLYEATGSKVAMGGLWLISFASQWGVQLLAGPLIDRWKRTAVMQLSEAVRAVVYLAAGLLWIAGERQAYIFYTASLISSFVMYDLASGALLPKLVSSEDLTRKNAWISGSVQLMRTFAFPLAGLGVQALEPATLLLLLSLQFTASFLCIRRIRETPPPVGQTSHGQGRSGAVAAWSGQIRAGWRVFSGNRLLIALALFVSVTSFGVSATQAMYIPYITEVLGGGAAEYGWFTAAFPCGYVLGSWAVGRIKGSSPKLGIMLAALLIGGATYVGLSFVRSLPAALMIELAAGMAMPFWNVFSSNSFYRLVPEQVLGQVLSIRLLLMKSAGPLGIIYGTYCAAVYGIPQLFLTVGLLIMAVTGTGVAWTIIFRHNPAGDLRKYP